jgi:thioredoxin reductase (NADPH)
MVESRSPRPVLLAVNSDSEDLAKIKRELFERYGKGYRIVCHSTPEASIGELERCKADGEDVAVVLADLWMPEMNGPEFLERARLIFPTAKRVLLIAWRAWGDRRSSRKPSSDR